MSIIKAPCGLNLDADTFEVEGQTVKGKGGELPPATTEKLGGVKIGEGVNVTEDGTISVTGGGGELTPCTYTFAIQELMDPTTVYRNIPLLSKGRGYIGEVLTLYIPAINRALGNRDEHTSGDHWYTILSMADETLGNASDFVQIPLTEDGQVIKFIGLYQGQA